MQIHHQNDIIARTWLKNLPYASNWGIALWFPFPSAFSYTSLGLHIAEKVKYKISLQHLQQCSVRYPVKIFFTSKFSDLLFCNPAHITETGTASRLGRTNSEPPGRIIMITQSETLSSSQIKFTTVFSACVQHLLSFLPATAKWTLSSHP
jgi:hypothetical protein